MFKWILSLFKKKDRMLNLNNTKEIGGFYIFNKPTNDPAIDNNTYRDEHERLPYNSDKQDSISSNENVIKDSSENWDQIRNENYPSHTISNYNSSMDSTNIDSINNFDSSSSNDSSNW